MRAPRGLWILGLWGGDQGTEGGRWDSRGVRGVPRGCRDIGGVTEGSRGARGGPGGGVTHIDGRHLLLPPALGAAADAGEIEGGDLGGLGGGCGGHVDGEGAQGGPPQPPRGAPPVQAAVGASDPGRGEGGRGRGGGGAGGGGGHGRAGVVLLLTLELWGRLGGVSLRAGGGPRIPRSPLSPPRSPPDSPGGSVGVAQSPVGHGRGR